jgi:hypothetical protein
MSKTLTQLAGRTCDEVKFDPETGGWVFLFSDGVTLRVEAPWRIVSEGIIAVAGRDHGHKLGLPAPIDAIKVASGLLVGRSVATAVAKKPVADLAIRFEDGRMLEVFNESSGYEGWELNGPGDRWVVAQGGGKLVESTDS